jgi:hypothetical protein
MVCFSSANKGALVTMVRWEGTEVEYPVAKIIDVPCVLKV